MFQRNYKFEFPKGLPFLKRLELKKLCRNVELNAPGYSDSIALVQL